MKGRPRERITHGREREIIELINGWSPRKALSRTALAEVVESRLGFKVTRQGLMKRDSIRKAYEKRERELSNGHTKRIEKEPLITILEKRIEELKETALEREKVLERYKELFLTYRYNARQLGIAPHRLEAPLPRRSSAGEKSS